MLSVESMADIAYAEKGGNLCTGIHRATQAIWYLHFHREYPGQVGGHRPTALETCTLGDQSHAGTLANTGTATGVQVLDGSGVAAPFDTVSTRIGWHGQYPVAGAVFPDGRYGYARYGACHDVGTVYV